MRSRWGDVAGAAVEADLPGGAAMAAGGDVWVLAEDQPARSLGAALAWATRHGAAGAAVHLLASAEAGTLARRASLFDRHISVWPIEGTNLAPAPALATPLPAEPPLDPSVEPMRALIAQAGAEAVVEGGLLRAEVLGLEVARVEIDDDGPHLAVGVGRHDRDAQREVRGRDQGLDQLFEVVRIVAEHRVAAGAGHAAFHLAPERWLRSLVVRRPDLVGAAALLPSPSPVARHDLRAPAAAPAAGISAEDDEPLVVVCSVGTDADLVPSAVDAWLADGREPLLRICVPEGDDYPMTRDLVGALSVRADLVTVPPDWREL